MERNRNCNHINRQFGYQFSFNLYLILPFPDAKAQPPGSYCLFDNVASLEGFFKRTGGNLEVKFDKTVS